MRLLIDLDENWRGKIPHDTLILCRDGKFKHHSDSVIPFQIDCSDENPVPSEQIRALFSQLPKEYSSLMNTAYMNVFRVITATIVQVNKLIKEYPIEELVLVGGFTSPVYTLVGGDGEGTHWTYSSGWLLNPILSEYYKDQLRIHWTLKQSKRKGFVTRTFRNSLLYLKFIKRLAKKIYNLSIVYPKAEGKAIGFVTSDLQLEHFRRILSPETWKETFFISPFSGKNVKSDRIFKVEPTLCDYLMAMRWASNSSSSIKGSFLFKLEESSFTIDLKEFALGLRFSLVEYQAIKRSTHRMVVKLSSNQTTMFLSNMTFGIDIVIVNELSKTFNVEHVNYQAVTMGRMLYPQLKLANKFYLYSRETYELYHQYEPTYLTYFPVNSDNLVRMKIQNGETLRLVLFTQPDHYTHKYLQFLSVCAQEVARRKMNVSICIKPHYRQDQLNAFRKLVSEYKFLELLDPKDSPRKAMQDAHFMMSMTSSVLFEAIQEGCPGIILGFYSTDIQAIQKTCFPKVNLLITNFEEFFALLQNPEKAHNQYFENRVHLVNQENAIKHDL